MRSDAKMPLEKDERVAIAAEHDDDSCVCAVLSNACKGGDKATIGS